MSRESTALVSAHCAVYNGESFIEETVRSVLDQTVGDLEMVVVDDGSTDGTWNRLKILEGEDCRLRVFRHGPGVNRGLNESLRLAVAHSTGKFLARIDADDRWKPAKLERQLPALEAGALFSYGRACRIDEYGNVLPREEGGGLIGCAPRLRQAPAMTAYERFLLHDYVPCPTAVFSREAYEKVGGYDPSVVWQDYYLWARLAALGRPEFVDDTIADYRLHTHQLSTHLGAGGKGLLYDLEVIDHLSRWPELPEELASMTESWRRCHRALISLVNDDGRATSLALVEQDATRLALLFEHKLGLLEEFLSLGRIQRWVSTITRLGPPFDEVVSSKWKLMLARRIRASCRGRQIRKAAHQVARLAGAKLSDLLAGAAVGHVVLSYRLFGPISEMPIEQYTMGFA